MAITLRATDAGEFNSGATITATKPAGTLEGDLIVINYVADLDTAASVPSGFTEVISDFTDVDTTRLQVFMKTAGASEPSTYEITTNTSAQSKVTSESYYDSGGGGSWVIGTPATAKVNSGACSVGPITTDNNSITLGAWVCDSQNSVTSAPSGMTLSTTSATGGASVALNSYREFVTTGTSTSKSLTYSGDGTVGGLVNITYSGGGATVTQTDTTPEDGVQQSFTTTGLTGTITAATLGGYDILSLLSDTDPTTATTYTLDISAIEASQGAPRIGQTSTLSITATGGTATTDVVIQPKTGWAEVDLAGTLNKDSGGFLAQLDSTLGLTSAVGDIIYYDASSNAAITATGVYTSDLTTAGQNTPFVIQQGGSATTVSTSEGGAFYPYGEAGGGSNVPKTKYRRFPWQPWNPL